MRPGDLIDIWVVEKALGAGGMGSVYRCHNRSAKRILAAIKVLDASLRRQPGAEERFVREAEILFTLDHPNIVRVRNIRVDVDPPYLEMEFVEGESLDKVLMRGALPWRRALPILTQLADALAYLHARGVRHRDVKPANVLVRADGRICLVDFGLAMEANQSRLTESNTTFGTVSYAPPEWIDPDAMDPEKWDIYALGVVTWEMLRGEVAFPVSGKGSPRQQAMQVIIAKQNQPALDPGPDFREDARSLVRDLTEPDPGKRPVSMAVVRDRIRGLDPTTPPATGPTLAPPPPQPVDGTTPVDTSPAMRTSWARALARTPVPAEPTPRPRGSEARTLLIGPAPRRPTAAVIVGAGLVGVLAVGAITAALLTGPRQGPTAATRGVEVVVSGLAPGTDVELRLDGKPASSRTSWVWRFADQGPGTHAVTWAVGPGCASAGCPGAECPAWCGTGETAVEVVPGDGPQSLPLALPAPPARSVRVALPEDLAGHPVTVRLGDSARTDPGGEARFEGVLPGRWPVEVSVGSCPPASRGCLDAGTCPPGCASWATVAEVPWGDGVWEIAAAARAPAQPPGRSVAAPAPAPTAPRAAPAPPPATSGAPVTVSAFASWLAEHPEWQRDAAIAAGLADQGYLPRWSGATPPAGTEGHAVRDVSWYAAAAFCKDRGGLADLAAAPTAWEEGPQQPYLEWRTSDGRAAWRSGDDRSSTKVRLAEANSFTGIRCAR